MQTPEVQLASPPTTIQAPCPAASCQRRASCQWRDEGAATICGETISCKDVAQHLRVHVVKRMNRGEYVVCKWQGCSASITRNNIARHIWEGPSHLGHHRDEGHLS
ncbi:hypothetical protein JVT61DRAFT_11629 [Boletus reticuloceps]|uniref:Uncharacterized protein n=1 Tax=Boletus reticuloceps TaxID=495285 RepID=A0A8I2YW18_9AGAM|nr:hypothetical protein JVT61DRAFT_11629 [Boletus reticuloceps]